MDDKRLMKISRYLERVDSAMDPVSIQAGITDFCFNKCHMCNHHKREHKHQLSGEDWIHFLSQHNKIESVCYSGGDMMSHPDINRIMQYHIDNGVAFGFITAGYIPMGVSIDKLKEARWVRCSLDSVNPETYSIIRGGLPVDAVIRSILAAKAAGVNIELTITVSEKSAPSLIELIGFAMDNKINCDIHPIFGESFKSLGCADLVDSLVRYANLEGVVVAPHAFGNYQFSLCKASYYQVFINSLGEIFPCCTSSGDTELGPYMHPLGNIWDWRTFLINRKRFSSSADGMPDICSGCIDRFGKINQIAEKQRDKSFF